MARINMISPVSIISNITGVHAIVPHDTISDHECNTTRVENCRVVTAMISMYIADKDEMSLGINTDKIIENTDKIIENALSHVNQNMAKNYYTCAHPSIVSLAFTNHTALKEVGSLLPENEANINSDDDSMKQNIYVENNSRARAFISVGASFAALVGCLILIERRENDTKDVEYDDEFLDRSYISNSVQEFDD
eukprot:CAMPEP_0194371254 /NCGR_PEP_ID=MMETSP0174-20130528/19648_1 /TAXON_ID=216777 /ORGANISM="Proboscia alata, Strain PI-D3" /LENGTH=193 /DNA_ID=CAMNT_0039149203 /DNA_START=639 /DNA_END=1220 /DNA_ORIENTATION=+